MELPPESLNKRAVELRVDRSYFDAILEDLPEQIESALGKNEDGTVTIEIDASTLPLDLPGIALGPFGTGVGFRDLVVAVDLQGLKISPTPNEETLAFRVTSNNLPVRIENAVVFGDVDLAGLKTTAACVLETAAPAFTTLITMDLTVDLIVGADGNLEPDVEILALEFSPMNISIIRDCQQPECSDQTANEDACFECGICELSEFGANFVSELQDILGNSFASISASIVEYIFNNSIASNLPILGDASLFRIHSAALAWSFMPEAGPVLGGLKALDLEISLAEDGLVTTASALEVALDISTRAPADGCSMDRPALAASPSPEITPWPALAPTTSTSTSAYDFGIRITPQWLERLFDEIFRSGAACAAFYGADITALLGVEGTLDQGALQLLFPGRKFLGDSNHDLRIRLHIPPASQPRLQITVPETLQGALRLGVTISGVELILTANNEHGPTWLSIAPDIELQLHVGLTENQNPALTIERVLIGGLDSGLTPATQAATSSAFLAALEKLVAAIETIPPIEIDLQALLGQLPTTELSATLQEMAPTIKVVGLEQSANQNLSLYLRTTSNDDDDTNPATIGAWSKNDTPMEGSSPLSWLFAVALTLALISIAIIQREHPSRLPTAVAFASSFAILFAVIAPACETDFDKEICRHDGDCVPGYSCSSSTSTCEARATCTSHQDCCAGAVCSGGYCDEAPSCEVRGCVVPGTSCNNGVCTTVGCGLANPPCAPGSTCRDAFCIADSFSLPCPDGLVFDPYALRCATAPPSCAQTTCLPGEMVVMENGPHLGPECAHDAILCGCASLPPPPGPEPDGSLASMGDGVIAWYDARYGDLIRSDTLVSSEHATWTPQAAAGQVLAGLPENLSPTHTLDGWRHGSIENGPDIGRDLSTLVLGDGDVLVAARSAPEQKLKLYSFGQNTGEVTPIMLPPIGQMKSRPSLYLDANASPCVAMVTAESTGGHAITRVCPNTDRGVTQWQALPSILLNTVLATEASCPNVPCTDGSVCASTGTGGAHCVIPSTQCVDTCDANEVCSPATTCEARVAPQDIEPFSPYPLSVSSGPGPVVAITTQMGPSEVLGVRWTGEAFSTTVVRSLIPAGGRGVLSVASERADDVVWILLALDRAPGLELYRWDDNNEAPSPATFSLSAMPNEPRNMARTVIPYSIGTGSQRWLVRSEPEDKLWMLFVDALGQSSWSLVAEGPILGVSVDSRGTIYGWYVEEGTPGANLGAWLLSED